MLSHRDNNTQRIAAMNEAAKALGLKPGTGIADARAMYPHIEIIEADPEADALLLSGIADWCDRFTPLVGMDSPDGLFLNIAGCAHLFGGEVEMVAEITKGLKAQGLAVAAGLASTPGAAWAAAHYRPGIVAPGGEAALLAPLPLAALRCDAATCTGLESVGLSAVGSIMSAPRAPLVRRFGPELVRRLDQALGSVEEAISPRLPVPPLSAERRLAEPIGLIEDIERLTRLLANRLKADLERRGEGARYLQLSLFRVDGDVARLALETARPVRDPALIEKLFREKLGVTPIDAGFGFDMVRLSVLVADRMEAAQTDLAGDRIDLEGDIGHFVDRVRARLGRAAAVQPVLLESHVPERAVRHMPYGETATMTQSEIAILKERPLRMFEHPEPVEAVASVPDGPPVTFRWRRVQYRVARAEGPERIAPEWWHDDDSNTRDYFRVEDETGRRFWLYRDGLYESEAENPRWFLHGVFA